jgi:hypothetical protein
MHSEYRVRRPSNSFRARGRNTILGTHVGPNAPVPSPVPVRRGFSLPPGGRQGVVDDLSACTYADAERFYSYRRMTHRGEADYGRHVNAIVLG